MTTLLRGFGDRVLERLVPKATAKADVSYYKRCACYSDPPVEVMKLCHVVGGTSGCTGCDFYFLRPCS
ncbi:hypothetical protein FH608_010450 [Nonomuraea phyllanthi]|uniref:Uncharacterized protein n=1 Tax=Nonomuraea phyllanthi TaxID=2219224 RepID=A0A5C4WSB8_9ACTN|nr:hypothetical protein [Nonomuraea phyllanthi]KAB8195900.1 hypothetical protein FH608_010450 [Nonomuraea phyllanthi]QFY07354.1 hypothetical protein GBF35_12250 [Nonomuraea phyllanthi]